MRYTTIFAAVAASSNLVLGQSVEFFYTDTVDLCSIDGASIPATDQTTHGGVCAYRQDVARVYACPAPDPTCWTYYETCVNGGSTGQTVCNRNNAVWCCNSVAGETCTTTQGQINVCISNFTSPNSGVSVDQANQKYLSALGVSNVTATSQTVDPSPFSTRIFSNTVTSTTSSSTSSAGPSTLSSSGAASTSDTGLLPTSTSSPSATAASSSGSGISGGAIAGIVIGAIVAIAIIGAGFFLLGRRNKNKQRASHLPIASEMGTSASQYNGPGGGAYDNGKRTKQGSYNSQTNLNNTSELGSEGHGRVEMATSMNEPPVRHEMA
ncbi:hypothetical protein H2198_004860 [Neophaeococcomyces mojaviensis]|uniref:Uncharacterized protein n=1 Tax=Neophaeococcomyces mojaviensis TaxID=3383035 RepID=A0ACC3A7J3_9EURO|nr:hypothetical protein H2198_004860 [Knufia sp. JES_112]